MSKAGIIRDFKVLAQLFTKAKKNKRTKALEPGRDNNRYRAYTNAASAICTIPGDVIKSISVVRNKGRRPDGTKAPKREVYVTTNEVTNMLAPPGLGKATTDKIDEYIKTGKIVAAETARAWLKRHGTEKLTPDKHATKVFETIAGVGAATARAWLKHYNDIPKASRPTPIDWVKANKRRMPTRKKGVFKSLSHVQLIGLKYREDLMKRIPRHYIYIVQLMIRVVLAKNFGGKSFEMKTVGSYLRGAEDSGDIDILLRSTKFTLAKAVAVLTEAGIVVANMSTKEDSNKKFAGICHCPSGQWFYFHLDIFWTTKQAWGAALLAYTGSKVYAQRIRNIAHKQGYLLNQYGLFKKGHPVALKERDILKAIGEPYLPPECR